MLVPISWLKDYVNVDLDPLKIQGLLVSCGFEVEQIIDQSKKIINVFTAKIITIKNHPDTNKLFVCSILSFQNSLYNIVTNDIKLKPGNIVAVALDGAILHNGKKIFRGDIKGINSDGMFCGLDDLGLDNTDYPYADTSSVLVFDDSTSVGININDFLGNTDIVFDISITANRTDANSILGIAREIAAITGQQLRYKPSTNLPKVNTSLSIDNHAPDLCKRYIGCLVKNITISDSPFLIKQRLKSVGIRPINNIVDLTNYTLISIGQPMHAFDFNKISNNQIIVRRGRENESILALDGKTYSLNQEMLLICDNDKPMAIAGIMGGLYSSVSKQTTSVVFESATFARENIRATAKILNLHSDSSFRFEKGVDLYSQEIGMNFLLDLIRKYNWGKIEGAIDSIAQKIENKKILFTSEQIKKILGVNIKDSEILRILKSLGFIIEYDVDHFECIVPRWREDIFGVNDIAEELIRITGYEAFNFVENKKAGSLILGQKGGKQKKIDKIKDTLVGSGCSEIVTYSFISPKSSGILSLPVDSKIKPIKILNPLSEDYSIMRQSLVYSLLKIISKNYQRGNKKVSLFEIANVYNTEEEQLTTLPLETSSLCIASIGIDFFEFKNIIENLLYVNRINASYLPSSISYLHPYRNARIFDLLNNKSFGFIGELKTSIAEKFDINTKVLIAEIDLDYILNIGLDYSGFKPISKYQASDRDIAIIVPLETLANDILTEISNSSTEIFLKAFIFDIYTGSQIGQNEKSVAINLRFQSMTHTLTDAEINNEINNIVSSLSSKFNAKLR